MMDPEVIHGLYQKAKRYTESRRGAAKSRRELLKRRAAHITERRGGRAPSLLSRPQELRLRTYPATYNALLGISSLRMATPQMAASAILEGVAEIWERFPYDEELLLKRVDDPTQADGSVLVDAGGEPSEPLGDETVVENMLVMSIYLLILAGRPPAKVAAIVDRAFDIEDEIHRKETRGQP